MQISLIGLGKMGFPLALNLRDKGHQVFAFDTNPELRSSIQKEQIEAPASLAECIHMQSGRKVVWLMVPSGPIIDQILNEILPLLANGDIIVDGGNSHYKESQRRASVAAAMGINYLDCGTSGGTSGARNGICAMVGGEKEAYAYLEPLFKGISVPDGYLYCGASGSGHFTKMVHNGIEYGMMQSIAEGFAHLHASGLQLNMEAIAQLWNRGSVVRGWLMELTANALQKDPSLDRIKGIAHASGEAQWMVEDAMDKKVAIPVIALSLLMRFQSQDMDNFPAKMVAALRNEFGGHAIVEKQQ